MLRQGDEWIDTRVSTSSGRAADSTLAIPTFEDEDKAATDLLRDHGILTHPGYYYDIKPNHIVTTFIHDPEDLTKFFRRTRPRGADVLMHEPIQDEANLLFENHPLPMYIADRKTSHFLAVNEAAIRQYGYSRDEFLAMTLFDIRPPEEREATRQRLETDDEFTGSRDAGTREHWKKDGTRITVEVTYSQIEYQRRKSVFVVVHNVTDRIRVMRKRFASRLKWKRLGAWQEGSPTISTMS